MLLCVLCVHGILTAGVICVLTSKTDTVVGKCCSRTPTLNVLISLALKKLIEND